MIKRHIYLVSDFTGDTVTQIAHSSLAHFKDVSFRKHLWPLVNAKEQVDALIKAIKLNPGPVICTIDSSKLELYLADKCEEIGVTCIPVLQNIIDSISDAMGIKAGTPIKNLNKKYFEKIECIEYTLTHDDGQIQNLNEADIVIIGVSRTSKTPTGIYLAYKGYKVVNFPYVSQMEIDRQIIESDKLIIGLTISPRKLTAIRKHRIPDDDAGYYTDYQAVTAEVREAETLFVRHNWPVINITNKSVEETAANIIKIYHKRMSEHKKKI